MTLPSSLQYIGSFAFQKCASLQKIEIPGSCTLIGTGAFWDCTGITEVTLGEGITEIGSNMFCNCTGIKEIMLPDSVQKIGGVAFQNCTELEKITLNQGLTEIGQMAFKGCDKLTGMLVLPDSVTTIRQDAFVDSSLSGVHVGSGLTILESGAFPDTIRLTTNSPEVWKLLSRNTDRENAPVFVWDGTCDVPAGMHAYVEDDIAITGNVTIGDGAIVTILSDASLTVDGTLTNNGTMEAEGALIVNGTLTNNGTVKGAGAFTVNKNGTLANNGTVEAEGAFTVDGTITGTGTFGEGMQMTFLLTEDMVAHVDDAAYSAAPIMPEPEVSITLGGKKVIFEEGTDFTYSYANNTNLGTADITVTPIAGGKLKGEAVTTHFTIGKAGQTAPAACNLTFTENEDGQTFTATIEKTDGAEYSFDGETWADENAKTDCQPNTEYTAYIRMKETDTHSASEAVTKTLKTSKLSRNAPAKCNLTFTENADKQTFTAMIEKTDGAEYSFDGKTWTDENTKTDCQPNTEYTAYIRMKETDTHFASDAVQKTLKTPELKGNTQDTGNTGDTGNSGGTTPDGDKTPAPETKPEVKANKIQLSIKGQDVKGTLKVNYKKTKSVTLKATVTPADAKDKSVKWTSSNTKIATVNAKGKVSFKKKAGKVTITATNAASGKSAKVTFNVGSKVVKVTKLSIKGNKSMKAKQTQTLKLTINPITADNTKITWKSSNKKIATVDKKGKVKAVKKGKVTITATNAASKKKAAIKITVK